MGGESRPQQGTPYQSGSHPGAAPSVVVVITTTVTTPPMGLCLAHAQSQSTACQQDATKNFWEGGSHGLPPKSERLDFITRDSARRLTRLSAFEQILHRLSHIEQSGILAV